MTVATTTNRISYACDGATVVFPYTFKVFEDSDLEVTLREIATGAETSLTLTTDYTVSGAGGAHGGNVTTVATYSADYQLIIRRVLPYTQETDYIEGDSFPAESHEDALDRLTMLAQQLEEALDRALKFSVTSSSSGIDVPDPSADKVLGWNAGATALENKTVSTVESSGILADVTGDITVTEDNQFLLCDGTFTVTLPPAANGALTQVCNVGTGTITVEVDDATSETFEGAGTSLSIVHQYDVRSIKGDGTDTYILI